MLTKTEQTEVLTILRQKAWDERDKAFHLTDRDGARLQKMWQDELNGNSDRLEHLATKIEELEVEE